MEITQSKYLTQKELNAILKIAKKRSDRDYAIILLSYRHGLRCIELLNLSWDCIDWDKNRIFIHRAKGSDDGFHNLAKDEISLLKRLKKRSKGNFVISGREGNSITTTRVRQICKDLSLEADLNRPFHHHMLRHTCGHQMANNPNINPLTIQRYLGHRDSKSTEVYIREAGRDFKYLGEWWK